MNIKEFKAQALAAAKQAGCTAAEVFYASSESFSVNALNGDFDRYEASSTGGISLRVAVGGHDGYAYTEAYEEPETLARRAVDNARTLETEEEHPMQTARAYAAVERPDSPIERLSERERIKCALRLEKLVKAADKRVQSVVDCEVGVSSGTVEIENTLGLSAARRSGMSYCYTSPMVEENGEIKTGFAFRMGKDALDMEGCAKEAVEDALAKLGAKPVPSGNYRILLKSTAAADLLAAFSSVFSAEAAQKGLSLLKGREGTIIGSELVTLIDDPLHPIAPRAFDGEGTPTYTKDIVKNGRLITLFHNLKTAKKAGVASTGNAVRASAASPVGVGPAVFYLKPGEKSFAELLELLDDGLVITGIEGLHAGLNPISGDFSLKAEGYLVKGGKRVHPVHEITAAGNFLALLNGVEAIGKDLFFDLPGRGYTGAPSLIVNGLSIGGK